VGIFVAMLTAPRGRRAWLVSGVVAVSLAAVVFAPGVIVSRFESSTNVESDVAVATRYYMTVAMEQMIADRPIFGTGLGAFDRAYPAYRRPGTSFSIVEPNQVPLDFVAETGIVGLGAEIALLVALGVTYWRRRPRGWDPFEAAMLAGTVALLVGTAFENFLYFEYVWLFFALSVVATRLARAKEES
jgi:O-antigen ligase